MSKVLDELTYIRGLNIISGILLGASYKIM
jgi:hypothetical protein